ncbi:MAG: hypothetical protein AAF770_00435, partial [Bacteroidota bacterium]
MYHLLIGLLSFFVNTSQSDLQDTIVLSDSLTSFNHKQADDKYRRLTSVYDAVWSDNDQVLYEKGDEFPVNTDTSFDQILPDVATFSDRSFIAIWEDFFGISGRIMRSNSSEIISQFTVSLPSSILDYAGSVSSFSNDQFVVCWAAIDGISSVVRLQLFYKNATRIGIPIDVASYPNGDPIHTAIVTFASGEFAVAWSATGGSDTNSYGVYTQVFANNGTALGAILQANNYTTMAQQVPRLTAIPSTRNYVVTWESEAQDTSGFGTYATVISLDQQIIVSEFLVATSITDNQVSPNVVAFSDASFLIGWDSYDTTLGEYLFLGQFFYRNGTKKGLPFTILGTRGKTFHSNFNPIYAEENPPSIQVLANNQFLVVFHNTTSGNADVYGQIFSSEGNRLGTTFLINDHLPGDQAYPFVDASSDNCIIVLWTTDGQDGDGQGIYGKSFSLGTASPTISPTDNPTLNPTLGTTSPSLSPTLPSLSPTSNPSTSPSINPTFGPSLSTTSHPSTSPSINPTFGPSLSPTSHPSASPSINPT